MLPTPAGVAFKDFADDLPAIFILGGEKQVINHGVLGITHGQRLGHEPESRLMDESLSERFHERRIAFFFQIFPEKGLDFSICRLLP
jgi:hypothetical protein